MTKVWARKVKSGQCGQKWLISGQRHFLKFCCITFINTDFILGKNRVIFLKNAKKICGGHTCHFFFRRKKNFVLFILATFFSGKTKRRSASCSDRAAIGDAKVVGVQKLFALESAWSTTRRWRGKNSKCTDLYVAYMQATYGLSTIFSRCLLSKASIALLHRVHCSTYNCITVNNYFLIEVMKIITGPTGRQKRFGHKIYFIYKPNLQSESPQQQCLAIKTLKWNNNMIAFRTPSSGTLYHHS